jgi:hypothetical protein
MKGLSNWGIPATENATVHLPVLQVLLFIGNYIEIGITNIMG